MGFPHLSVRFTPMFSFATRVVRIICLDAPELSGMGQVSQEMQLFMWVFNGLSTQWMWDIDGVCLKVMYAPNGLANE